MTLRAWTNTADPLNDEVADHVILGVGSEDGMRLVSRRQFACPDGQPLVVGLSLGRREVEGFRRNQSIVAAAEAKDDDVVGERLAVVAGG